MYELGDANISRGESETPAATITQVADEVTNPGTTDRVPGTTASTRELDAQFKASRKEAKKAAKAADKAEAETDKSN